MESVEFDLFHLFCKTCMFLGTIRGITRRKELTSWLLTSALAMTGFWWLWLDTLNRLLSLVYFMCINGKKVYPSTIPSIRHLLTRHFSFLRLAHTGGRRIFRKSTLTKQNTCSWFWWCLGGAAAERYFVSMSVLTTMLWMINIGTWKDTIIWFECLQCNTFFSAVT